MPKPSSPPDNIRMLAFDPSLVATGCSMFEGDKLISVYQLKPKLKGDGRFMEIAKRAYELLIKFQPDIIAIETQYISIRSSSVIKVIEVKGIIEGVYFAHCFLTARRPVIIDVTPTEARKGLGMVGRYNRKDGKEEIRKRVLKLYPSLKDQPQDIFDSIAIGLSGLRKRKLNDILFS